MPSHGGPSSNSDATFSLRYDLRPGDLGAIVSLHGTIYAQECGFDSTFEAHVAYLLGAFVQARSDGDRLWIAEWKGRLAGSIAILNCSGRDAQMCWLLVDPSVRSLGLERKLLQEAVGFCRNCGYEYVFYRNARVVTAASHLLQSVGFEKVQERRIKRWGVAMAEEWYVLHPFGRRPRSPLDLCSRP